MLGSSTTTSSSMTSASALDAIRTPPVCIILTHCVINYNASFMLSQDWAVKKNEKNSM
jgi:hypothetical protein